MGKNVAVFVDVANIFYAAKAAGVDIDYVTLLKSASAGRDLVRAYAYTGLDPDNENQRNFHDFLRRSNYKVVSKDIRKYGDGKIKANLDIELVVDMMKTARNLDIAIVVSGDGDFAPAIRAVQEQGVRVEVISFRGNTSSDLIEVADLFTDIVQLARVEKGSRSGRRVSDDDADLSMTEVPDKQTEGTGAGRGRGRDRGRGRGEAEPVAASASRGRGRGRTPVAADATAATAVVALPGERLSRAGGLSEADLARAEVFTLDDTEMASDEDAARPTADTIEHDGEDGARRRRRRGGRGRGRGRGRGEGEPTEAATSVASNGAGVAPVFDEEEEAEALEVAAAPTGPRTTPFGSVWDSQLGTPAPRSAQGLSPVVDDEDFDEPEIPEYLIAEQRRGSGGGGSSGRGGGGGGRGPRGGRSAYQSAVSRERYGGGRSGGINRYPDVSARTAAPREDRSYDRGERSSTGGAPRRGGGEWSEVPPELEAQLRAQISQKPLTPAPAETTHAAAGTTAESEAPAPKRRTTRKAAPTADVEAPEAASTTDAEAPAPKRRTTRKAAPTADADATSAPAADAKAPAPKRRTTSKAAPTADAAAPEATDKPAAKRRTTRKASTPSD